MRTLVLAMAAFAMSGGTALAQGAWADKLFMNKTTLEFGNVARGSQLKQSIPMKNIWAVPLEITNIRVSCGCVSATPSKKLLQPQEEATLDVVMDTRVFTGAKTVTVYVTVGPQFVSTASLRVSANARTDVTITPGEINFGVVGQGQQPAQTVNVEYVGFQDWRVKEVVKPADAPFSVTMEETSRKPPVGMQAGRVAYRMTVKLSGDATGGALKHDLVLRTNDPASDTLIVSVSANIQAALRVAPGQINLGLLKLGETKTFKVQVMGNRPFRILEVMSEGKEFSADIPSQPSISHTITVRCQPLALGELKRILTIVTDLDNKSSVTVSIQANASQ